MAMEKEAKRQRSEPTTPVSTSSRRPCQYDAAMGITRVGTKEAERFEEGLDLVYHDASDEPLQQESQSTTDAARNSGVLQGGCGSSSLRECIELLNKTVRNSPATLHSGSGCSGLTVPQQKGHRSQPRPCDNVLLSSKAQIFPPPLNTI